MTVLNERSRRFLTLVLFILLGPSLLFFVGYKLFVRNSHNYLTTKERSLSQFIEGSLYVSNREFLRPGAQRLLNVSFKSAFNEEIAFCPEVYLIKEKDSEFIRKFASSFDSCYSQISNDEVVEEGEDGFASFRSVNNSSEEAEVLNNKRQQLEKLLFSNENEVVSLTSAFESQPEKYTLIVVPTLLCRDNRLLEIKATLINLLRCALTFPNEDKIVVGLAIGNLRFISSNEDYLQTNQEVRRKSNQELASYFNESLSPSTLARQQSFDNETENKIRLFESEDPCIDNIKLLYIGNKKNVRVDATFELDKLSQEGEPRRYLSFETDNERSSVQIEFNSPNVPTPVSLIAQFVPFFQRFGKTCWFSGQLIGNFFSSEYGFVSAQSCQFRQSEESEIANNTTLNVPLWSVQLKNVRFQNCDLESIDTQISLPAFSGTISNLSIDKGIIRQGVFEGTGAISIRDGAVSTEVLGKLCKTNCLEVGPSDVLNYRFINDSVPFNEFELQFTMNKNGVVFDSKYPNKIVACYEKGEVKYGFFLPQTTAGHVLPYARPLYALVNSAEEDVFRTPLFKGALKHLPVTPTASINQDTQTLKR